MLTAMVCGQINVLLFSILFLHFRSKKDFVFSYTIKPFVLSIPLSRLFCSYRNRRMIIDESLLLIPHFGIMFMVPYAMLLCSGNFPLTYMNAASPDQTSV